MKRPALIGLVIALCLAAQISTAEETHAPTKGKSPEKADHLDFNQKIEKEIEKPKRKKTKEDRDEHGYPTETKVA